MKILQFLFFIWLFHKNFVQNSVGEFELGIGGLNDTLNYSDVNEVDCTNLNCNKRVSCAGKEWLVGRQCNRPIGAREARKRETF